MLWFATVFVGVAWFLAPCWLISSGVEQFARHSDSAIGAVAGAAYEAAWSLNDNPIGRLVQPSAPVRRVWRDRVTVRPRSRAARDGYADYRAEVRFYSYFGPAGRLVHVTCGGWAWSIYPPSA